MFPERFLFTKKIGRQEIIKLPWTSIER
jgi:hypothetical protein